MQLAQAQAAGRGVDGGRWGGGQGLDGLNGARQGGDFVGGVDAGAGLLVQDGVEQGQARGVDGRGAQAQQLELAWVQAGGAGHPAIGQGQHLGVGVDDGLQLPGGVGFVAGHGRAGQHAVDHGQTGLCEAAARAVNAGDAGVGVVAGCGRGVAGVVGVGGDFGQGRADFAVVGGVARIGAGGGVVSERLYFWDAVGAIAVGGVDCGVDAAQVGFGHARDASELVHLGRGHTGGGLRVVGIVGDFGQGAGLIIRPQICQTLDF